MKPHLRNSSSISSSFTLICLFLCYFVGFGASLQIVNRRNALGEVAASFIVASSNDEWIIGTKLPHLSAPEALLRAYATSEVDSDYLRFPMAKWPDPVLRIPAQPVPAALWNTDSLFALAHILRDTARKEKAVGLAAQQCGIDIPLIFIDDNTTNNSKTSRTATGKDGIFLVNPRFVYRSPETQMMVWDEQCLVMPPTFRATVLRDRRVVVESETLDGSTMYHDFVGENSRVVQHECQHSEGVLIVDHIDLDHDDLVTNQMRLVESENHFENQRRAFARPIVESSMFRI